MESSDTTERSSHHSSVSGGDHLAVIEYETGHLSLAKGVKGLRMVGVGEMARGMRLVFEG